MSGRTDVGYDLIGGGWDGSADYYYYYYYYYYY